MQHYIPYAYLKTVDGEEVREYIKENFEKALVQLEVNEIQKSDRTLYFITKNADVNGIKFFKNDYFEVIDRG